MDFERAEYVEPRVIEGEMVEQSRPAIASSAALPLALLYGAIASVGGAIAYGFMSSTGFVLSIVVIGIGWLIAKAMMTASRGFGGRKYQIAACLLTYISVSGGHSFAFYWLKRRELAALGYHPLWLAESLMAYAVTWPMVIVRYPVNGAIGLLFLLFGLRTAWQMAAGSPGFASKTAGSRVTPFG